MAVRRVLSIDGGGVRGIIPALILSKIEEYTKKPISTMFDLIAGTSTGGIIALGLTCPSKYNSRVPAYSASELVDLYMNNAAKIFPDTIWKSMHTLWGLRDERYPSSGIEGVLKDYFGGVRLSQSLTNVLITSYEIEKRVPFLFKSSYAKNPDRKGEYDFYMWQAGRATSAAPTYFEVFKLTGFQSRDYYALIDGGVFANNPAMCAYAEAKNNYPDDRLFVLSIGTGTALQGIPYNKAKKWGVVQWAQPILGVVLSGVSDTVDYQLRSMMSKYTYYRLQPSLSELGRDSIDDSNPAYLESLKQIAEDHVEANIETGAFQRLCKQLVTGY